MRHTSLRSAARLSGGLLVPGVLFLTLTACTSFWSESGSRSGGSRAAAAASSAASAAASFSALFGNAATAGGSGVSIVSCTGDTCTVTLGGSGSTAQVLGTTFSIRSIAGGRATLRADDQDVSCAAGETASAGSLRLECAEVTSDTVRFTVTRV